MIKIGKLPRHFKNLMSACFYSTRRYQFKVQKPIYYPKRELSKEDDIKTPVVQEPKQVPKQLQKQVQVPQKLDFPKIGLAPLVDYYEILGIPKVASIQEIKASYYDLAKKFHPDASPTPQETKSFQLISEAYHVLSDESSRFEYDRYGLVRNVQPFLNAISIEAKASKVQLKNKLNVPKALKAKPVPIKKALRVALKDVPHITGKNELDLELNFLQAVQGGKEFVELKAMVKCPRCNGSARLNSQFNVEICQKCGGTGQCRVKANTYMTYKQCDMCEGTKYVTKNICKTCNNRGFVVQSRRVEVEVPAGVTDGDTLQVTNPLNNQIVKVRLTVDKSTYFKRDGNNVATVKYLTISQAVLGGMFKIRGLSEDLEVVMEPGIESHTTYSFKGKGITTNAGGTGDHIVTFKIRIPKTLTTKQRQLMLALERSEDPTFDGQ